MELQVTQENFARALAAVSRVASTKAQLPILSNILLRTDGNRLLVAATNLEIASTHYIGAKVATAGSVTVPARLITEFVSSLPKEPVQLSAKDGHLELTCGNYRSVINGVVADEFPELPTIDEASSLHFNFPTNLLKQALTQTILTASSDSTRPILTGVYWYAFENGLYLAATDGYRLAEKRLGDTPHEVAVIIPATTLQEVLRSLGDASDDVDIVIDDTQVRFRINESEITSRLIDGNYPDYRQLIPDASDTVITVDAAEFGRIAKIASLFARESGGSVTITASSENDTVAIHSVASELGENTSSAAAEVSSDGTITLNSRYLSEALSVLEGPQITIRFSGKLSPCVMTGVVSNTTQDYKHIIMPLKS